MSAVTRPTRVPLRPLTFAPDGDDVVVGCAQTDSYAVLPPDGAALLQQLAARSVQESAQWYRQTYGEEVDLDDFLEAVRDLGFLEPDDDPSWSPPPPARPLRWRRTGELLLSWPTALLAVAVVAAAVVATVLDPALRPHPNHVFFSDYLVLIEVTVALGQLPLVLVHEVCHVLAARRLGVPARIRVSHRFSFVVFETVMDGLVLVPRRRRVLPILAGMMADLVLAALLTLAGAVLGGAGSPPAARTAGAVLLALAFTTLVRLGLEFALFLRSDVYHLLVTLTGAVDPHTTSTQMLANRWWRLVGRPERVVDPARWHPRDVVAARWYLPVHLLGYAGCVVLLALTLLPVGWRFLVTVVTRLLHPDLASATFYDALLLLVLTIAQPVAAGLIWLRERAARRRSAFRRRPQNTPPVPSTPSRSTP